ncbi:MAG: hypothetical protein IKJ56_04725 [Bacteroidales bacterium]|nr:hypothetical protein [Bacteroidales bacterium]
MNEYIFYTCEGFTYPPKDDIEVENCQVLGRAYGGTPTEARNNLLKENPWINECGFNVNKAICKQLVTNDTTIAIKQKQEEIEYLVSLLDKRQLDEFEKWLQNKKK